MGMGFGKMRLGNYIIENKMLTQEEVFALLQKECKPWLKATKGFDRPFIWRGTRQRAPRGMLRINTRTNRRPKDTPLILHNWMDDYFKKKFGWKGRSEGVFCTGSAQEATLFGIAYAVFPIGSFKFIWSPAITDMTEDFREEEILQGMWDDTDEWTGPDDDVFRRMIKTYTDKDLKRAIDSDNEIMIKCKSYFLVDDDEYLLQDLYGWKR